MLSVPEAIRGAADALDGQRALVRMQSGSRVDAMSARTAALDDLRRADRRLSSLRVLPLRITPGIGRQIRVAVALARSGALVAESAEGLMTAIDPERRTVLRHGSLDLPAVAEVRDALGRSLPALREARKVVDRSPRSFLVPPVRAARREALTQLRTIVAGAEVAAAASRVAPALFGSSEPRAYFVLFGSLAELRGTGGFPGMYGIFRTSGGRLTLDTFGRPTDELPSPERADVKPPDWYTTAYARLGGTSIWQSINVSSDFPTVGDLMVQALRVPGSIGPVDGVLQLDPVGLAALLAMTGPLEVPPWPEPISAENVSRVTQYEAYVRFAADGRKRVEFLGAITKAVFERILSTDLALDRAAIDRLGSAASGGHIQAFAVRPDEQRAFATLGIAGDVGRARRATDVLGVVTQNWNGTKLDWFLRRSVSYTAALEPGAAVRSRVVVKLRNEADPSALPSGPFTAFLHDAPSGWNRAFVLYQRAPSDELGSITEDGRPLQVSRDRERELRTYSHFSQVAPGASTTLEGRFSVPDGLTGRGRRRTYRLHVLRQPVATPDVYDIRLSVPKGWHTIGPASFSGTLERDLVLDVRIEQTLRAWAFETAVLRPLRIVRSLL